jgi:hypothetical protein
VNGIPSGESSAVRTEAEDESALLTVDSGR